MPNVKAIAYMDPSEKGFAQDRLRVTIDGGPDGKDREVLLRVEDVNYKIDKYSAKHDNEVQRMNKRIGDLTSIRAQMQAYMAAHTPPEPPAGPPADPGAGPAVPTPDPPTP